MTAKELKRIAAAEALKRVSSGMWLGLGSGSTAKVFVELLGEKIASGELEGLHCVATSDSIEETAASVGISLEPLSPDAKLALVVDGLDAVVEHSGSLYAIKGGGGHHFREMFVGQWADHWIGIADESKLRPLHAFALPVEIKREVEAELPIVEAQLRELGATDISTRPARSENGNLIWDVSFKDISDPVQQYAALNDLRGIYAHGLVVGIVDEAIIARADGSLTMLPSAS